MSGSLCPRHVNLRGYQELQIVGVGGSGGGEAVGGVLGHDLLHAPHLVHTTVCLPHTLHTSVCALHTPFTPLQDGVDFLIGELPDGRLNLQDTFFFDPAIQAYQRPTVQGELPREARLLQVWNMWGKSVDRGAARAGGGGGADAAAGPGRTARVRRA